METLVIYPSREKYYEREKAKLTTANIGEKNRQLIMLFRSYVASTGSREYRVSKLSGQLRHMCEWLKELDITKNLDELNKNELIQLVAHINQINKLSEHTRADYRRVLKQFYRWFKDEDLRLLSSDLKENQETKKFYSFIEKEISASCKKIQADPHSIITDIDIAKVIDATLKARDRAFLSLLHESGCRAAEFLNLKIENIIIKEGYAEVQIPNGKTGKRTIFVVRSLPFLLKHIETHPFKNDKSSYLWLGDAQNIQKRNLPLMHIGGQRILTRCFQRAGVKKRCNWHWFRHSRATILAPKLTETMLCKYMGWTLSSRQIKNYVHLCNAQLENVFLAVNGLKQKEEETINPTKCICGTLNSPTERYCYKCYKPLSVEVAIQDSSTEVKEMKLFTTQMAESIKSFMDMMKNPEMLKQFEEFKKTMVVKQ